VIPFEYPYGSTPLDPDEAIDLIPSHITSQSELNLWEEANITEASLWGIKHAQRSKKSSLLTEAFIRELHRKMFNRTWRWSGTFRKSNKNIGVDWPQISIKLDDLLKNTAYQLNQEIYTLDELATRFHHQLVWIHPFPNGNGRHARLMTDCLLISNGGHRFSWGEHRQLTGMDIIRKTYIDALRKADLADFSDLLNFVRS
jgi:Fic-DOC domain mobile mystery protein B